MVFDYFHFDVSKVKVKTGDRALQGKILGELRPGTWKDECGYTTYQGAGSVHIHWVIPTNNSYTIDSWTIKYPDDAFRKNGEAITPGKNLNSTNVPRVNSCPTSGGVILYLRPNYSCDGFGDGSGYVRRDATGDVASLGGFNNSASSVRVPDGWSVKLYQTADFRDGWACRTSDDKDFSGDKFNNGEKISSNISSFKVYKDRNCGGALNSPPSKPDLSSPANGSTAQDGRAPTLCWKNSSDPDGNPISYYVEVYDSPRTANSGWISKNELCWRPSTLDGNYNTYKWRVKAKDGTEESPWSDTRTFAIESPNQPPVIALSTANGSTDGLIISNSPDWVFTGTASDPDGSINRIEFRCSDNDCGSGAQQTSGNPWSLTRTGISGNKTIWFVAYDNRGRTAESRKLELRIDRSAPAVSGEFNGKAPSGLPAWFTSAVTVRINARDEGSGNAIAGIASISYQLDGGGWQQWAGDMMTLEVTGDGEHALEYYATDRVGNRSATLRHTFRIDRTPPAQPSNGSESNGAANNVWQKSINTPAFIWPAATDVGAGLTRYDLELRNPDGSVVQAVSRAAADRQYSPGALGTGEYVLVARSVDAAGNVSPWNTLFTFRFDGTAPDNPGAATHGAGVLNNTWQRLSNVANFTWPAANDQGSGIKDYSVYWGANPSGEGGSIGATPGYANGSALCASNAACTGYLRVRSRDRVDNLAINWATVFVLRYDGAVPTVDFTFNGGVTLTNESLVRLDITAADEGSGVNAIRFSSDGKAWTDWEAINPTRMWQIPAISGRTWPVYVQVRDAVGNQSSVVSHSVLFDVNRQQPSSESYRLFTYALAAGAGPHASPGYRGRSSVGQSIDSVAMTSSSYRVTGGFEAGSQAIPIEDPNAGSPDPDATPIPTTTPGPPPPVEPPPACEFATVSIGDGDIYTGQTDVALKLCAPRAVQMMVSNDGGFSGAQWEPYATSKRWQLTTYGAYVMPRYVYVVFKDAAGYVYGPMFDDIIFDPTPPTGAIAVAGAAVSTEAQVASASNAPYVSSETVYVQQVDGTVLDSPMAVMGAGSALEVYMPATDTFVVAEMQLSDKESFEGAIWQPYSAFESWTPAGEDGAKTVYARFRDGAGNVSNAVDAAYLLDTVPPIGGVALDHVVAGIGQRSTTLYLGAEDNLTGATAMRVSEQADFGDAVWQPYVETLSWTFARTEAGEATIYVQYRDAVGNVSEVFSASYIVDVTAPFVYAEAQPGADATRTIDLAFWDEQSEVGILYLSNDPRLAENVMEYTPASSIAWTFDERGVGWVVAMDSVGNKSEPFPVSMESAAVLNARLYLPSVAR
ncbi:MAG: hypothetical protein KDE01_08280 [Caldilineaceae bacterium]|nr:hypothetical protein [Caldilineaceae bacterium]MCB9120432.1 hypothetical protein [Caldilineaceae bacterium]